MKNLIGFFCRQPTPPILHAPHARAQRALDTYLKYIPPTELDGEGDHEDFWEMAYRVDAIVHSGASRILMTDETTHTFEVTPDGPVQSETRGEALWGLVNDGWAVYGPYSRYSGGPIFGPPHIHHGDAYFRSPTFLRYAGRRHELCGYALDEEYEDSRALEDTLADFRAAGIRHVLLKATQSKAMRLVPVGLEDDESFKSATEELWASFGHRLGLPDNIIVQELIDVRYEYRVFIADGKPVTGAANIEEHTPLDNEAQFDTKVREHRGITGQPKSAIVDEPELVQRMVTFAADVAAEFAAEGMVTYVMDVALDKNGEPFIVELNGMSNSGLFASDPTQVVTAVTA